MSLKTEILKESQGQKATFKQTNYLYRLTGLKFWQVEQKPEPTVGQASLLITACKEYIDNKTGANDLIEAIQIWFPDFDDLSQIRERYFKKNYDQNTDNKPGPKKTPELKETTKPKETPKPKRTPKPTPRPLKKGLVGAELVEALIEADIKNLWMVGPAGCGKTTICQLTGEKLELPVTIIPCGAGTSPTTFLGYKYPEREGTAFVQAFAQPGIIVLDEFTALEAPVAQIVNSALANNELEATTGTVRRNNDCYIIATSNTFGNGADRMYVSNNQLDASTIDRFMGGIIEIDYSPEYEKQFDMEVANYVWKLRDIIKSNALRKLASTRSIISGCKLKEQGLDWKHILTQHWSADEQKLIANL